MERYLHGRTKAGRARILILEKKKKRKWERRGSGGTWNTRQKRNCYAENFRNVILRIDLGEKKGLPSAHNGLCWSLGTAKSELGRISSARPFGHLSYWWTVVSQISLSLFLVLSLLLSKWTTIGAQRARLTKVCTLAWLDRFIFPVMRLALIRNSLCLSLSALYVNKADFCIYLGNSEWLCGPLQFSTENFMYMKNRNSKFLFEHLKICKKVICRVPFPKLALLSSLPIHISQKTRNRILYACPKKASSLKKNFFPFFLDRLCEGEFS